MRSKCNIEFLDIVEEFLNVILQNGLAQHQGRRGQFGRFETDVGFMGLQREVHFVPTIEG